MIPYETCLAIRDLVKLLVEVRQYWMSMKYTMKFGSDELDANFGNHGIVFDYSYEVYLNRLSPTQTELINIRRNGTVHAMYAATYSDGWRIEMADFQGSTYDNFGFYNHTINQIEPHDFLLLNAPSTADDYDSALFQFSTIYDPQVSSMLLVYLFVRDILQGSGSRIATNAVLFQLHDNEIRRMIQLLEQQFKKLQELEIE